MNTSLGIFIPKSVNCKQVRRGTSLLLVVLGLGGAVVAVLREVQLLQGPPPSLKEEEVLLPCLEAGSQLVLARPGERDAAGQLLRGKGSNFEKNPSIHAHPVEAEAPQLPAPSQEPEQLVPVLLLEVDAPPITRTQKPVSMDQRVGGKSSPVLQGLASGHPLAALSCQLDPEEKPGEGPS